MDDMDEREDEEASQSVFRKSMEQVWNKSQTTPGLPTDTVKHAESEKKKLLWESASK